MKLEPGSRLAHYEILELIGKGGMGEVYRAHDARLPRDVAVKTSVTKFSDRFEREARVIASLNHPNICTLFDVGPDYLVMEMIEGPALAEHIKDSPLSLDDAVNVMRQVADALDYAHERGVVHRDLKPGNIKIRPDGVVKVLDFGLAKVATDTSSRGSQAETLASDATEAGVVLGTAAYMSPEQVLGKLVDKRTDVWAFGVVFYEALTGARMHKGDSSQEIAASVLKDEPDLTKVPLQVRRMLRRCLEKDPNKRLRHVGDVMSLLDEGPQSGSQPSAAMQPAAHPRRWLWPILAVGVVLAVIAAVLIWTPLRSTPPSVEVVTLEVSPAEGMTFNPGTAMTVSPDGRWMVFQAAGADGITRFWVRSLEVPELRPLPGTENIGAISPPAAWSFDSRWVIFASTIDAMLKKVDIQGGPPQLIAEWPSGLNGASQNSDGVIVGGTSLSGTPIYKVAKGEATPITEIAPGESNHLFPQFLPDGKHFLYLRVSPDVAKAGVYIGDIDAKPAEQSMERLLPSDRQAYYAAQPGTDMGYVVFMRQDTLMAQPFDAVASKLHGEAVVIPGVDRVDSYADRNFGIFSVSDTGTLAYRGGSGQKKVLTWHDSQGRPTGTLGDPDDYAFPAISPDGNRVAVAKGPTASRDIWILDARGNPTRFTFDPGRDDYPAWQGPDGKNIVFSSNRSGQMDLYIGPADSPNQEEALLKTNEPKDENRSTDDGKFLVFSSQGLATGRDIWAVPLAGQDPKATALVKLQRTQRHPRVSPDGGWLAYTSGESGTLEIYVRRFTPEAGADQGPHWLVSKGGGVWPVWRPDSKGLYYYVPQRGQLMTVDIDTSSGSGSPLRSQALFAVPSLTNAFGWDLSPDGKRFLFIAVPGGARTIPFTVKLNWAAGLKQ